ncbi:MAG: ABC transporter permease, partial [Gemmatimonadetes bacterium]|nr:ABC transporter permease [Gemmatimonadota bacterium]
ADLPEGLLGAGEGDEAEGAAAAFRALRDSAPGDSVLQAALIWKEDGARLLFDSSRDRSARARSELTRVFDGWKEDEMLAAGEAVGLTPADLDVWEIQEENTASARQRGQDLLARVFPLILLLMLAQGTFYSALDTVVGERERGTLETLLTSPLARGEALFGKFLFVVTASVVALALNLVSLTLFFGFILELMGAGDEVQVAIEPAAIGLILLTSVLTAAVLAALFMVVSVPARTYREGQATLTPLNLLIMLPGLMVSFDSDPFGMNHAAVPVLNSAALFKSVIKGEMPAEPIAMTLAVLAATAAAGLFLAARLSAREEVYFDPTLTLRRLLTGRGGGKS